MADLNNTLVRGNLRVTDDTNVGFIHSNAAASTTSLSTTPSKSAIVLETGNGDGNVSSWLWRENWSSANFGIFHDNSSNILKFVGDNTARLSVGLGSSDPHVYISSNLYVGSTIYESNTALSNKYLGISSKAADSDLLDGHDSSYFATSSALSGYLPLSGDTMTGLLTTTYGNNHNGVKIGSTYVNAISSELILQNNGAIRFGADDWDYNKWAGLKYDATNKIVYLGVADGSIFTANSAQTGTLKFPGITDVDTNTLHASSVADSASPNAAAIEVREYNRGGTNVSEVYNHAPRIGFHWQNRYWANMAYINDEFHFLNNNCNAYRPVRASSFYENDVALSSKYLQLSGGNVTGILDATTLKENGVLLTTKYALKTELPQIDDLTGI